MDQIIIAITGMVSIWLTQQHRESWKRYACLIGMAGQPFFLYATFIAEQWGMLLLSSFYTYSWSLGIYNNWIKPQRRREVEQPRGGVSDPVAS